MRFALFLAIVLTALVVTFSLQNAQPVQVQFLAWYFEGALVLVLLMTFVAGAATMYLASLPRRFARGRELADLRRRLEESRRQGDRLQAEKGDHGTAQGIAPREG
ncbi:lipopolysaccharide assembly LapA domain-containing protein [Geobacter sp.]|uniref:LapA family protein n=1 Tax=Geobacter sp. TaxID=46610 RepID=UPI001AC1683C|nr:LapA family protein [Geobacter sp.]CAG0976861.1 hypothetical protein GEOBC_01588 [Geobacteraceae bacterium]